MKVRFQFRLSKPEDVSTFGLPHTNLAHARAHALASENRLAVNLSPT